MKLRASCASASRRLRPSDSFALLAISIGLLAAPLVSRAAPDPELRRLLREAMEETRSFPDRFDAQVWLTDMATRLGDQVADPEERIRILKQVHREETRVDLPPEMVLAVIDIESAFDAYAVSVAGAR